MAPALTFYVASCHPLVTRGREKEVTEEDKRGQNELSNIKDW
jgi:hypothetical protein